MFLFIRGKAQKTHLSPVDLLLKTELGVGQTEGIFEDQTSGAIYRRLSFNKR